MMNKIPKWELGEWHNSNLTYTSQTIQDTNTNKNKQQIKITSCLVGELNP